MSSLLTIKSRYDNKILMEIGWDEGGAVLLSVVEELRRTATEWVHEGLGELYLCRNEFGYDDTMPRHTPPTSPYFLSRVANYLLRQTDWSAQIEITEG
jgi:hypothetical protein